MEKAEDPEKIKLYLEYVSAEQKRSLALAFPLTQMCPSLANLTTVPDLIRS